MPRPRRQYSDKLSPPHPGPLNLSALQTGVVASVRQIRALQDIASAGMSSVPVFHNPLRCRPSPPRSIVGHERQNSKRANGSVFSAGSDLALTRLWLRRRIARLVPDMHQPVVRTHPETGRPSLFLSPRFTLGIDGATQARSDALLHEIFALIEAPRFHYRHQWRENELMIWDNKCLNHRVRSLSLPRHPLPPAHHGRWRATILHSPFEPRLKLRAGVAGTPPDVWWLGPAENVRDLLLVTSFFRQNKPKCPARLDNPIPPFLAGAVEDRGCASPANVFPAPRQGRQGRWPARRLPATARILHGSG